MRAGKSVWFTLCGITLALSAAPSTAQPASSKPEWMAAHDLKVRKGKDTDWEKAYKIGVEVFTDPAAHAVVAINAAGNIAVAPIESSPAKKVDWVGALSFSVRGANEKLFTANSTLFGVEVFKGAVAGHLLYVTERGGLAFHATTSAGGDKDPQFQYGLSLKVRKPDQERFTADSKAYGIEAYKDNNTSGLVYITEAGLITTSAAVPEKTPTQDEIKKPKALYGLTARVRKADEAEFTDKTQKFGIEVFRDENTNTLIYLSETGSIAAAPPVEIKKDDKLTWMHAMVLKARAGGESDFSKAKRYGIEVFMDKHTGHVLFVTETGAIAVLPQK